MWPYYAGPLSRAQFADAFRRINAEYELLGSNVHELLVDGDFAAVHLTVAERNRGAGAPVQFDVWFYLRFRNEDVVEAAMYPDAAKAAGLMPAGLVEIAPHAGAGRRSQPPSKATGGIRTDAAFGETEQGEGTSQAMRERRAMEGLARDFFALRAKGDFAAMLGRFAPDFVYNPVGTWTRAPLQEGRCDRATFAESLRLVNVEFEDLGSEVHELLVDGDRVAVHRTIKVRNRGAGDIAHVDEWLGFRIRSGLIVEMASYVDCARVSGIAWPPYVPAR